MFGAEKLAEYSGPDGKSVIWAMLKLGESRVLVADAVGFAPATRSNIFVYVRDVDSTVDRAKARGAKVVTPPSDMFWGDRWAIVEDSDGNPYQIATHIEDVTPQEIGERNEACGNARVSDRKLA